MCVFKKNLLYFVEFDKRDVKPNLYSYSELKVATQDFHSRNELGRGGFGIVYKVYISNLKLRSYFQDPNLGILVSSTILTLVQFYFMMILDLISIFFFCCHPCKSTILSLI